MSWSQGKRALISICKWLFVVGSLSYIGFGIFLYLNQRSMIYHPTAEVLLPNYQAIYIRNNDVNIKIWQLHAGEKRAIIFFGGNADPVDYYIPTFDVLFPNHSVYLVNYRGYGGSSGQPTEQGLYRDAIVVYEKIKRSHTSIAVIGRSLGSGVASYLASQKDVEKLILITPFDSILHVAQNMFPIYPMSFLLQDQYNSIECAQFIDAKILFLIAGQDRTIPTIHTQLLISAFKPEQISAQWWKSATHNDISHQVGYNEVMVKFLNDEGVETFFEEGEVKY